MRARLRTAWSSRGGGRWLALAFVALYLLSTGGNLFISDGEVIFKTTAELVFARQLALQPDPGLPQIVAGRDGRYFSKYGLGHPLAAVPFFRVGAQLASWRGGGTAGDQLLRLTTVSMNALLSAGAVLLLYLIGRDLYGARAALMVAALYGLATPAWVYSKVYFSEPLLTLCLLLALYATLRAARGQHWLWPLLAGAAAGYAMLTKPLAGVALPVFAVYIALGGAICNLQSAICNLRRGLLLVVAYTLGALPLIAFTLWHNWYRFGSIANNGYGAEFFSTPWYIGLYGLLWGSGRGLLWYAPPLLLALWAWGALWRARRDLALLWAALIVPPLLITARWWAWHGGWGWGPRLIVPYLPFALLAIGFLLYQGRGWRRAVALLVAGALVQLPGVAVNFNTYMAAVVLPSPVGQQLAAPAAPQQAGTMQQTLPYLLPDDLAYHVIEYSPLIGQWRMLLRGEGLFWHGLDWAALGVPARVAPLLPAFLLSLLVLSLVMLSRQLVAFNNQVAHARAGHGEQEVLR
jgi:4-amino-4-deoxy-L-arabinose transferase-like glycosyltransferase